MESIIDRAAKIAVRAHEGQTRKGDESAYVAHPFAVALLLAKHGFSDVTIAAALVHDVLEDTPVKEEELRAALGDEVVDIVKTVSEDKSLVWEERKVLYLEAVQNGSVEAKAVSLADKIHNLQSIIVAHHQIGNAVWSKFKRGKETTLELQDRTLQMFKQSWDHPMIAEYEALLKEAHQLV